MRLVTFFGPTGLVLVRATVEVAITLVSLEFR